MLNIVIALQAEAKPLLSHYRLVRRSSGAFVVYDAHDMTLIVSGVGKQAAAAATSYLHSQAGGNSCSAWLNIGIAGHSQQSIGDGMLAHKITDQSTGRSWYPPLTFEPPCTSDNLITVDKPETRYYEDGLYDMEAAGFYRTACRFTTIELVHCYKIVSDNPVNSTEPINAKVAQTLIEKRVDTIDILTQTLSLLATRLAQFQSDPHELAYFLERFRFTVSQRHQLRRLLLHWHARSSEPAWSDELARLRSGDEVLAHLRQTLDDFPLEYART